MPTIHSLSPDGQERYDTVHKDNVAKTIKLLQQQGQLKIKVMK